MSLTEKLRQIGEEIKNDPGVRGGVVQTLAGVVRVVFSHITSQPELPAQSKSKELQRR
jgi:hypothetical protein